MVRTGLGLRLVAFVAPAVALAALAGSPDLSAEAATSPNRAVVVIDTGTQRTTTCVRFNEAEITGIEALRRSGASLEERAFGSMGSAVCSINGVGCAVSGCLTCAAPVFWNYFRAPHPSTTLVRWGAGAGSTKVRDGDVEAWVWTDYGPPPPRPSVDAVCGPRSSPAPPPSPGSPPPVPPPPPGSPGAPGSLPPAAAEGPAAPAPPANEAPSPSAGGDGESGAANDEGSEAGVEGPDGPEGERGVAGVGRPGDRDRVDEGAVALDGQAAAAASEGDPAARGGWGALVVLPVLAAALVWWGRQLRRRRART